MLVSDALQWTNERDANAPPVYAEDALQIAGEAKRLSGFVVELLDAA